MRVSWFALPVAIVAAVTVAHPAAAAGPLPPTLTRVRAADSRVASLMETGYAKSPTFRSLVDDLQKSDLIVYVSEVPYLPEPDAGAMQLAGCAGVHRYVRISVKRVRDPKLLIAAIAHELQHARELAENPQVVSEESLETLYRAIGRPSCNGYETEAARETGNVVCREMER